MRYKSSTLKTTLALLPVWLAASVGVWLLIVRVG